ncbi:MAG: response regulator containing a CheY-like receiver domain and an DNA-binding domain [Clostridia bacterium]|jgi:DNA-binding NarL/FixJ family response regulator|nr:response regulator containing a CheY-like receiver domain and an DNA-binding domain [Clostridia bacterium]
MIKVLIADDQQLLLDLLEHMLSSNDEIQVVGKAVDGNEVCEYASKLSPDVIVMDLLMPNCNGIEATKFIKSQNKNIKVLILTTSTLEEDFKEALACGADGYILKSAKKESLILAIQSVYCNMQVIDQNVGDFTRQDSQENTKSQGKTLNIHGNLVKLSERELKIIKMIAEGKTTSEIAHSLYVAEGRLRNIITEILSKLMLKDRAQIVVFAIKNNLH